MKVTYQNRHGDNIVFEKINDKTIKMSGGLYMRMGYPNVYNDAYSAYCNNEENPMDLEKFKDKIHEWDNGQNPLKEYQNLVYSDRSRYDMVDPSGGPYICVGSNLKYYFNQQEDIIVKSITSGEEDSIIFYTK